MNLLPSKITCFATNNRKSAPFPIHQSSPKDSFGAQVRRWTRFWLSRNIDPCSSTSTAGSDLEQDCSGGRNRVLSVEFARQNSSKIRRTNLDLSSQTLTSALSKVVLMVITAIWTRGASTRSARTCASAWPATGGWTSSTASRWTSASPASTAATSTQTAATRPARTTVAASRATRATGTTASVSILWLKFRYRCSLLIDVLQLSTFNFRCLTVDLQHVTLDYWLITDIIRILHFQRSAIKPVWTGVSAGRLGCVRAGPATSASPARRTWTSVRPGCTGVRRQRTVLTCQDGKTSLISPFSPRS